MKRWLVLASLAASACSAAPRASANAPAPSDCTHPPRTQAELDALERRCPDIQVLASIAAKISDDGQYLEITGCKGQACGDFHPYRIPLADVPRDEHGNLLVHLDGNVRGKESLRISGKDRR